MELTQEDRHRIEQAAIKYDTNEDRIGGFIDGAEYATIYERTQQALPPDNETVEDGGGCYVAGSREVEAERTEKVTDLLAKVSEQEKEIARLKYDNESLRIAAHFVCDDDVEVNLRNQVYNQQLEVSEQSQRIQAYETLLREIAHDARRNFRTVLAEKIEAILTHK